jgi:hypothetical protein
MSRSLEDFVRASDIAKSVDHFKHAFEVPCLRMSELSSLAERVHANDVVFGGKREDQSKSVTWRSCSMGCDAVRLNLLDKIAWSGDFCPLDDLSRLEEGTEKSE